MKYLIAALMVLALVGCERESPEMTQLRLSNKAIEHTANIGTTCMHGVQYYYKTVDRGAIFAPVMNQDSTVKTCER